MYDDRPDTISGRMRGAALWLDFYDMVSLQYTIPSLEAIIESQDLSDNNKLSRILAILKDAVSNPNSDEIQNDLREDADKVHELQEFYDTVKIQAINQFEYSIARDEERVSRFKENQ